MDRDEAIRRIRDGLKRRSGLTWSVTGGRGTAWGWITITAPPARRTCHSRMRPGAVGDWPENYEDVDTGVPGGYMTLADRESLAGLLGLTLGDVGLAASVPAGDDHRIEYVDRAEGRTPTKCGVQYWD